MAKKEQRETKDIIEVLQDLIQDPRNPGILKEIVKLGIQNIMELERDAHIGAGSYERTGNRKTYRNGYKPRQLNTRVGSIDLRVPQTRDGEFYPSILERYQRSERAVIMALYEAYVNGVSTRKMKKITEVLLGKGFSSSSISRYAEELDQELEKWRTAVFKEEYVYVIIDARYDKCRVGGQIIDVAVFVAIGINAEGKRRVLSLEVSWGENNHSWNNL